MQNRRLLEKFGSIIQDCVTCELIHEATGKWFQEKLLSFSLTKTVPQTDTGGRDEYSKALERTREKELGKLTP